MSDSKPYFYHLDAIRFSSALIVMLFHFSYYTPTSSVFVESVWFGWVGVQIFFVISGFVICESAQYHNAGKFIRSRFLRLYPAALVCAALSFMVLATRGDVSVARLLNSALLLPRLPYLTTAYWTLPIEMAFYGVVVVVMRASQTDRVFRLFAYVLIAYSAAYVAAYTLYLGGVIDYAALEFGLGRRNMLLMRHGVFFGIGILLFLLRKNAVTVADMVFLAIAVVAAAFEINARAEEVLGIYATRGHVFDVFVAPFFAPFLIFALSVFAMVAFSSNIRWTSTTKAALRIAGLATYPLYLLHESLGFFGKKWLEGFLQMGHMTALAVSAIGTTVAAALIAIHVEPRVRAVMAASIGRIERAGASAGWANMLRPTGKRER